MSLCCVCSAGLALGLALSSWRVVLWICFECFCDCGWRLVLCLVGVVFGFCLSVVLVVGCCLSLGGLLGCRLVFCFVVGSLDSVHQVCGGAGLVFVCFGFALLVRSWVSLVVCFWFSFLSGWLAPSAGWGFFFFGFLGCLCCCLGCWVLRFCLVLGLFLGYCCFLWVRGLRLLCFLSGCVRFCFLVCGLAFCLAFFVGCWFGFCFCFFGALYLFFLSFGFACLSVVVCFLVWFGLVFVGLYFFAFLVGLLSCVCRVMWVLLSLAFAVVFVVFGLCFFGLSGFVF